MKMKSILLILIFTLLTMLSTSCTQSKSEEQILFQDILSIEIIQGRDNKTEYTAETDKKEIKAL